MTKEYHQKTFEIESEKETARGWIRMGTRNRGTLI